MINLEELEVLKNKIIYNTNNDEYVVYEKNEHSISSVDYKLLGFLNGYSYSCSDNYLVKSTIDQVEISRILLSVEVGTFVEGISYMYFYKGNTLYQVTENLDINWELKFDDDIRQVVMDNNGDVYILFKNSRVIRKYSKDKEYILYLNNSDDPVKYSRLYAMYISEGCGHLYVIGSDFWDSKVRSYIDHYDVRKCKLIDRQIICEYNNVEIDDEYFTYKDIYVDGDYIYIYANNYIERVNLKSRVIWKYGFGYNYITKSNNCLANVVYDNKKYKNRIYFCENLYSSGGYSFGKLDINGSLLWKITYPENNIDNDEFNICIYNSDIFITTKRDISAKANYVLSLDNNKVLFETREGRLVRIVEDNYDAIYDPENYTGRYLIGDKIKEGIPRIISYSLLHNSGEIVTENDEPIILDEPNKDYRNPNNYDYFRIIGTNITDTFADYSCIRTKDGKMILTKNKSYIETLYPYLPDMDYQYITSADGSILTTDNDLNIIRSAGVYIDRFYILADAHKFFQHIITKKEGKTLITKKKGFRLTRKAKYVYRYVIKRLIDIDVIVQYLQENGILNTFIPHYVDKLRHHTTHMIQDMQKALSPTYFNIQPVKRYGYRYDGYDYPLRVSNTQIFMCKNIPYIKKRYTDSIYIESMVTLVENEEVTPFILFLNGKAIKWSDMTIVRDWFFSYIIINNNADESENLEAIMFPCVVRYGEDNSILPSKDGMYFDNEGKYTKDISKICMRMEVIDEDVITHNHIISESNPYLEFTDIEYNQLSDTNNIFTFENGYFFGDSRFYLDYMGKNVYTYARNHENVEFKTYYFDKANHSKNMLFEIPDRDETREDVINEITSNEPQPTDNFLTPFDFTMTIDKSYLQNVSETTKYILKYKMQLLIDFYRDQSNIKHYTYDGERVLALASKNGGYLIMPRQKVNGLFDYIMVFKNDKLYEFSQEIEYENRVFKIPIFDHVTFGDKIEILHFKKVCNNYSTLIVTDEADYIEADLRYDNFLLFGNSYSNKTAYDSFNVENSEQYEIEFDYKNSFNKYGKYVNTQILLKDLYYKNKLINICSKRQFHQMYYNVLENQKNTFVLEPEFRFCHNKNQYMIFVNQIKLNLDEWELSIMDNDHHLDALSITVDTSLNAGDMINIFYIPEPYEEIILENHTNNVGDVIMDVSDLEYPFDSQLFMIFLDGRKMLTDDIQNISSNRIRIKNTIPLNSNVCVCKYLNPEKLLYKVFSYGDLWTKSVESLSVSEYENLFVKINNNTNK